MATDSAASRSRMWDGFIAVAGATVGLATLIYFVGAVTVWVRLTSARVPPDIAIAHQSRAELISLGLRGILAVTALILVAALGIYFLILVIASLRYRRRRHRDSEARKPKNLFHASRSFVRDLKLKHFRLLAALAITILIGTSFISWRVFGMAFALVVVVGATLRYLYRYSTRRTRPSLIQVVIVVIAAGAAATAWQANERIDVQAVVVDPPPSPTLEGVGIPYFGESNTYVYLGEIGEVRQLGPDHFEWQYNHSIREIDRDSVKLTFLYNKAHLDPTLDSPAVAFWHAIFGSPCKNREGNEPCEGA